MSQHKSNLQRVLNIETYIWYVTSNKGLELTLANKNLVLQLSHMNYKSYMFLLLTENSFQSREQTNHSQETESRSRNEEEKGTSKVALWYNINLFPT